MDVREIEDVQDDEASIRREHEGSSSEENNTQNSWVSQVQERFQSQRYKMVQPSSRVCIYRLPELLIRRKREAYRPEFVSFGPFYHNNQQGLSAMEDHKLEAVQKTLERLQDNESINSIEDLIAEVQKSVKKIRDCYEDSTAEYNDETLAWMMTLDGCFILEFLRTAWVEKNGQKFSLIFINSKVENIIQSEILNDILKLENQIPLSILMTILKLEFQKDGEAESKLIEILRSCHLFQCYPFKTAKKNCKDYLLDPSRGACHLLDLCREMITDSLTQTSSVSATTAESCSEKCVPSFTFCSNIPTCLASSLNMNASHPLRGREQRMASSGHVYEIPRAELLHNAGIQFKTGNLRFEKKTLGSTLFLPPIVIEDNTTETLLRNLIIFEEYEKLKEKNNVISNYISFMNKLIDFEKDVALLTKEGIIINWLGSDKEVAALFNNLDKETVVAGIQQFVEVADQVKEEYNRKCKVLLSQFIEERCSKPWYIVSLVAAILILGMTAVQTVYSVKNS